MPFASFVGSRDSDVRVASRESKAEATRSKRNYPAKSKVEIDNVNIQHKNCIDDGRDDVATATTQPGVITPGDSIIPCPRDGLERDYEQRILPPGKECEENVRINGDVTIVVDEKGVETRANLDNDECIHGDESDIVDDLTPANHDIGASDISSSSISGNSNSDRNSSISNASKHLRKWKAAEKDAIATKLTNECDQELHTALPGATGVGSFVIEGDVMIAVDEEGIEARANNQRVISQDIEHALGSFSDCPSLDDITASIVDDGSIVSKSSSASSIRSRCGVKSIPKWIRKKSKIRLNSTTQRKLSDSLSNSLKTMVMQRSCSWSQSELDDITENLQASDKNDIASKARPPIVRHRPFSSPPSTCKPIPAYGHLWGIDQEKYSSIIGDMTITANMESGESRDNHRCTQAESFAGRGCGFCHGCDVFPNHWRWSSTPPVLQQCMFPDMNFSINDSTVDDRSKNIWEERVNKLNSFAAPSCFSDNSDSGSCDDRADVTEKPLPGLFDFGFKRDMWLGWSNTPQALLQSIFPEVDFSCNDSTLSKSTWQGLITPSCFSEVSSYSTTSQAPDGYH